MTTLRTAAQQALAFIRWSQFGECRTDGWDGPPPTAHEVDAALRAALTEDALQKFTEVSQEIEAALAEPVQEPVAWMMVNPKHPRLSKSLHWKPQTDWHITWESVPLYTTPPQRKPLTEEEIKQLLFESAGMTVTFSAVDLNLARAIERAHGIGGSDEA